MQRLNLSLEQLKKTPPSGNIHAVLDWYLLQRLRSPIRDAFSYGIRHISLCSNEV